jgi:cyanobactin biosynthesis protein (PatB/AcyB/McaB family)
MSLLPPQPPPVRRELLNDPYTTIALQPHTPAHLARVCEWLLYGANVNDPAAFQMPSYEQAKLSAL